MGHSINVPDNYGYAILGCAVLPTVVNLAVMSGLVMKARKELDVKYPNLYATPGYHKNADEFNRIQRGHQNMFETLTQFTALSLIGGLKHPIQAAFYGVCYSVGSFLYMIGYGDKKLDVKLARYKKGGGTKYIGICGSMGIAISQAGTLCGWW